MTTLPTVSTPAEIAQLLGYSGGISPTMAGRFGRRLGLDISAADSATRANPSGKAPLTLRTLRMASRLLFRAESDLRKADRIAGGRLTLSTPKVEFARFGAQHDIRKYTNLIARIDTRRKRLGLPRFMSDLTAAKVDAPAPDHRSDFLNNLESNTRGEQWIKCPCCGNSFSAPILTSRETLAARKAGMHQVCPKCIQREDENN